MSRRRNRFILGGAAIALIVSATSIIIISRASTTSPAQINKAPAPPDKSQKFRNLMLQPEALAVSRQLGRRFNPSSRATSTAVGKLTIGSNEQPLILLRRQTESGETVEVKLGNRGLLWSEREGPKAASGELQQTERLLAERVILDSPDQFVLAQLRGASYFTVAKNVRPTEACDDYNGPLWNIVRVAEPPQAENLQSESTWRLYYINVKTGLPDRIEYQLNGENIRVAFVEWTEQDGEKSPSHVTWTSNDQVIMEYRANRISHNK
jgi:hypothetical protein